jgi:hypothetical protein
MRAAAIELDAEDLRKIDDALAACSSDDRTSCYDIGWDASFPVIRLPWT